MQTLAGKVALVDGQQDYTITFSPTFGVSPTSFLPSIFIPNSNGEIFAVCAARDSLSGSGVKVWLNAPATSASEGGYVNWQAANAPLNYPTVTGQVAGNIALVSGQRTYQLTFPVPFSGLPRNLSLTVWMADDNGEIFFATPDISTLTPYGVTIAVSGTPTSASNGAVINWLAEGTPSPTMVPSATVNSRVTLIPGQQDYAVIFPKPFVGAPNSVIPTVQMPNGSGEILHAAVDYSTLTAAGMVLRLNGVPTSASIGGFINWIATGPQIVPTPQTSGMTVVQLLHRIGRRSRSGDFTTLSMSEQTDLLEAANTGLQKVYEALPNYFKERTEGFVLRGPQTLVNVAVEQFSKTVSPGTFLREQLGCSVQLDGDSQWNQVTGDGELLNPYMGATGFVGGIVYGDALYSDRWPLERIVGNPRFPNQAGYAINPLSMARGNNFGAYWYQLTTGVPQTWWVQPFGNSQGFAPFVVLKFAPLPNTNYPVNIRISYWPKRLTFVDYQSAAPIVVPEQFLETGLIPLCLEAYMTAPSYKRMGDENRLFDNARAAEKYLRDQPGQVGAPANFVYTPIGF